MSDVVQIKTITDLFQKLAVGKYGLRTMREMLFRNSDAAVSSLSHYLRSQLSTSVVTAGLILK